MSAILKESTIPNPITYEKGFTSTTIAMSALFLGTPVFKDIARTPAGDTSRYKEFLSSYVDWLALYIRKSIMGLTTIADIDHRMELIEVLKASLKPSEAKELEEPIKKLQDTFTAIKNQRQVIKELNQKANQSYEKSGGEILAMTSMMGKNATTESVFNREKESERVLEVDTKRQTNQENLLRENSKTLLDRITKSLTPQELERVEKSLQGPQPAAPAPMA